MYTHNSVLSHDGLVYKEHKIRTFSPTAYGFDLLVSWLRRWLRCWRGFAISLGRSRSAGLHFTIFSFLAIFACFRRLHRRFLWNNFETVRASFETTIKCSFYYTTHNFTCLCQCFASKNFCLRLHPHVWCYRSFQ